jgi:branched-chain amino acid transport system substrate-binding protein
MGKTISAWSVGVLLLSAAMLAACGDKEPVKLGFIGGTSGRVADLGIAGRNGAQLAVELANLRGGIDGRKIELLVRDDGQNPEVARQRLRELAEAGVTAVIGPMTSDMAVALLPLINEKRLLTVSPTATANELAGKDDYFLRAISPASVYAGLSAQYQYQVLGLRRVAVILDQRNKAYSENWAGDYRRRFEQLGGIVVSYQAFVSGEQAGLGALADAAIEGRPDGVVVVANSVDAALLAQLLRQRSPTVRLATAEWAATERFIELAGAAAEGVVLAQFFDRTSAAPSYQAFRQTYRERFGEEPGFGSVTAFDAANVLIESLSRHPQRSPKAAVMAIRKFVGVQNAIEFDPTGDARREVFVTVVRAGKYVVVPRQ